MSTPEKYFINQLKSHHCQLPPSDDYEFVKKVRKITNYFLISESNLQSYLKAKSLSAIYYEKRRQIRTSQALVIHPYSDFRRGWQLWMCFVFVMAVVILPFSSAFHGPMYAKNLDRSERNYVYFYAILYVVFQIQIFCLVDIWINFITGYVNKSTDEIIIEPWNIARRYLGTYFFFDFISSIPVDSLLIAVQGVHKYKEMSRVEHAVVCVLPLFKLLRLRTLYDYFYNIYGYFSSSYSVYKMVAAICLYFLIIHWSACLNTILPHIIFYEALFTCTTSPCNTSWIIQERIFQKNIFERYLIAFDRSVNCFTGISFKVYELKNVEDKLLAIVVGFTGNIYWMFMLVVFLQMISTMRSGKTRYLEMMDQVEQYMRQKNFPPALRKKIRTSYQYLFQQEYVGEESILKLLSENLKQEVVLRMHQNLIEKIHIFSGLSQSFVYSVISRLKPEMYLTDDVVYSPGEIGHFMYFVSFGTVAVYSITGREIYHVEEGEYFGEVALILLLKRGVTVIAVEPTQLYRLGIKDFNELIRPHPTVYPKMEKIAMERYRRYYDISAIITRYSSSKASATRYGEEDEDEDDESYDELED